MLIQRHGESEANARKIFSCKNFDPELTEDGIRQIESTIPFYSSRNISKVICSPSIRARQTADILCKNLNLEYEIDDDLIEVDLGDLEGKSYEPSHRMKIFHGIISNWVEGDKQLKFVGGESYFDVKKRIEKLRDLYLQEKDVLLVAHNTLFAIMMSYERKEDHVSKLFLRRGGHAEYKDGEWIIY